MNSKNIVNSSKLHEHLFISQNHRAAGQEVFNAVKLLNGPLLYKQLTSAARNDFDSGLKLRGIHLYLKCKPWLKNCCYCHIYRNMWICWKILCSPCLAKK